MAKLFVKHQKNRYLYFGLFSEQATLISLIKWSLEYQLQQSKAARYTDESTDCTLFCTTKFRGEFWVELILLRF